MNYVACEQFMDFCDEMMIAEEGILPEGATVKGMVKTVGAAVSNIFANLINLIQRLLNRIRGMRQIVVPKILVNPIDTFLNLSYQAINISGHVEGSNVQKLQDACEKLGSSKVYKIITEFDANLLKREDYTIILNSQKIISAMNLDLKLMKSYKSTADIKEASGGKGVAANYPGFRALQKIHMMRYKMYVKICSFVLPKE